MFCFFHSNIWLVVCIQSLLICCIHIASVAFTLLNFALQHLPCDNGVCCPSTQPIPKNPTAAVSSQDSVAPESSNVNSISSLPITECPATMKCVREDFCDADGVMVPYRVSLTDQEKRQRGTLIVSNSPKFNHDNIF